MKLNKNNFQKIVKVEKKGQISVENEQLISLEGLGQFMDVSQIVSLNGSRNHLKEIEKVFIQMVSLKGLNLQMNHIRFIAYMENLTSLQFLDLSTNRLLRIEKLNSLKSLKILVMSIYGPPEDLSMNYIEEMEELELPYLEQLYLQGNKLKHLASFANLPRLRFFDVSKNELSDINPILQQKALNYLEKLLCSYNKMPTQYLEDFCFILNSLPNLLELDAGGNELTINSLYRSSVLTAKRLKKLDGLEITDATIEQIQKLKNTKNFEQAITDTNKDFIERLQRENDAKISAKKLLLDQIDRIDNMFENFQKKTEKQQTEFMEYIAIMEKRYRQGEKIELDQDTIKLWNLRIQQNEQELKMKLDYQKQIQQHQRDVFLQKEVNGLTLREKLYDIAFNDPDLWRDIKTKELEQVYKEEKRLEKRDAEELRNRMPEEHSSLNYGEMENEMRNNIAQKIQNKLQVIDDLSRDDQLQANKQSLQDISEHSASFNDQKSIGQRSVTNNRSQVLPSRKR